MLPFYSGQYSDVSSTAQHGAWHFSVLMYCTPVLCDNATSLIHQPSRADGLT